MFKLSTKFLKLTTVNKLFQQNVIRDKQGVNLAEALGTVRRKAEKATKEKGTSIIQRKAKGVCAGVKTDGTKAESKKESSDIVDKCDMFKPQHSNADFWRKISLILLPLIFLTSAILFATKPELPQHDYIPYPYLYMHNKRFPWGDGRLSLLHGRHNFDPEEEEKRIDGEKEEGDDDKSEKGKKRYKESVDEKEVKAKLREQHAKEELKRRKRRHEKEKEHPNPLKKHKPEEAKDKDKDKEDD